MIIEQAHLTFVAQYWGSEFKYGNESVGNIFSILNHLYNASNAQYKLICRRWEQITEDELIELAIIYADGLTETTNRENKIKEGRLIAKQICIRYSWSRYNMTNMAKCFQFLIRLSILLPFTYIDQNNKSVTYMPKQLVQMNWAEYQK